MGASVVVTGANRGIGLATALELASAGYDVIGTARSGDKASALRDAAGVRGLTLRSVLMDVADAASTERGFAEIAELTGGGPWAVVNNAGFAQAGAIEDVDDAALRYQLEVNLVAPARIARLVLPAMRERGEGRIVNMSSIAGRVSLPLLGWYCAAKHGLEAMTDALRMEVAQYGIRVVLVEPGASAPASGRAPATPMPRPPRPATTPPPTGTRGPRRRGWPGSCRARGGWPGPCGWRWPAPPRWPATSSAWTRSAASSPSG